MNVNQHRMTVQKLFRIGIIVFFWLTSTFESLNLIKTTVSASRPPAQIDILACPQGLAIDISPPISRSGVYLVLERITFTGTITGVGGGAGTITYTWNFSDGTESLVTGRPVVVHWYREQGSYSVTLETDGDSCEPRTQTETITVTGMITTIFLPIIFGL